MSQKHKHNNNHNNQDENHQPKILENDYSKFVPNIPATNQTSYKLFYWIIPLLAILALLAYWFSFGQFGVGTTSDKSAVKSSTNSSIASSSLASSSLSSQAIVNSVSSASISNQTIIRNVSVISSSGLIIPNLKAVIDGQEFKAVDNQLTIQIDKSKDNIPVTITGDGYTTIKADKLDQLASLVQMPAVVVKPVEPVAVTPAPIPTPTPVTPQTLASRIAYTSEKDGTSRLYSAKSDGSDVKLLSGGMVVSGQIETKGSEVWYNTYLNDNENIYYKADINGGNLSKMFQYKPYEVKDGQNQQIAYDIASSKRIRIQESSFENTNAQFVSRLWVANMDGSNEKLVRERVYNDGQERVSGWKISPDGNKISYILYKYDKNNNFVQSRLLVVDVNNPSQFRTQWIDNNKNFSVTEMGFSGDNKYHLYTVYNTADQKSSTFIFDLSNTSFKEIKNLSAGYGSFTSDGKSYLFMDMRDDKADLYKINIAEATVSQLTKSGTLAAYYVNGSDIYLKYDKKTFYLDSNNQLVESKIETNNVGWLGGSQFYGGM